MTLTCKLKGGNEKKVIRIPIDPPLLGYAEVKPRLLSMKAEAQEGLGMVRPYFLFGSFGLTSLRSVADQSPTNNYFPPTYGPGSASDHRFILWSASLYRLPGFQCTRAYTERCSRGGPDCAASIANNGCCACSGKYIYVFVVQEASYSFLCWGQCDTPLFLYL